MSAVKRMTARHLEQLLRTHPQHGRRALVHMGITTEDLFGWNCSSATDTVVQKALKRGKVKRLIRHLEKAIQERWGSP